VNEQKTAGKPRRPYEPPRIRSSEVFERLALACTGNAARQRIKGAPSCVFPAGAS
jgi:hypothetical protein